jgi:hypothetical protein
LPWSHRWKTGQETWSAEKSFNRIASLKMDVMP